MSATGGGFLKIMYRAMVDGGAVTGEYARKVGSDGYDENAGEAVRVVKRLIGRD